MRGLIERPTPTASETLLLVDDDPPTRRSLQLRLRGCGYIVRAYGDGRNALADPIAQTAICLITDNEMASIDGISLMRSFRALGWLGVAILMTSIDGEEAKSEAIAAGFAAVIQKPIEGYRLVDVVDRALMHS
ncbi:response regulator [Sphingomonas nostoxanthinifaciens]|uniref:response regulator n=1 Tax=Sphingomonas nostoxanthinifaciens TaxID=2872652 RepID=UPI001CC1E852|nr:response regulator [Sphingomonas nostoxanthinifaciens]UAK23087.1 response regulator [Sphingomonas nostoxanthinifaciens]